MTKETKKDKEQVLVATPTLVTKVDMSEISELSIETETIEKDNERKFPAVVPVAFPNKGTYKIRIFPDRDINGKLRFMKRVFFHRVFGYPKGKSKSEANLEKLVIMENSRIKEALKSAESKGLDKVTKYIARENVYVMVRIIDCPKSQYQRPDQDVLLVLNQRQGIELIKFWNELTNEQKMKMVSPEEDYAIELVFGDNYNNLESVKYSGSKKYALESMRLPEGFVINPEKGGLLDQVYINAHTNTLTEETYGKFKNWLDYQTNSIDIGLNDPIEEEESTVNSDSSSEGFVEKCPIVEEKQNTGDLKDAKFGNPPKIESAECMICEVQNECHKKFNS